MLYNTKDHPDLHERIARLSRGEKMEPFLMLPLGGMPRTVIWLLIGIFALIAYPMLLIENSGRIDTDEAVPFSFPIMVAALIVIVCAWRLLVRILNRTQPCLFMTPAMIGQTGFFGDKVALFRIADYAENKSTWNMFFRFRLGFKPGVWLKAKTLNRLEVRTFHKEFVDAVRAKGKVPPEFDWISELQGRDVNGGAVPGFGSKLPRRLAFIATSLLLGGTVFLYTWITNMSDSVDDNWRWSSREDTAEEYGSYLSGCLYEDSSHAGYTKRELENRYQENRPGRAQRSALYAYVLGKTRFYEYIDLARQRYHERSWEEAREQKTSELYLIYIDRFPDGEHVAAARDGYDDARFAEARKLGTPKALRTYLKDFPKGRNHGKARNVLLNMYKAAEDKYLAAAKGTKAKPEAIQAMQALLKYLGETEPERAVIKIVYLPVDGLKGGIIEKLMEQKSGSKNVQPVGPSFTAELNQARTSRITSRVAGAFQKVVGSLFQLQVGDEEFQGPRILVKYKVAPSGKWYYLTTEKNVPRVNQRIFVGIYVEFYFTVQLPDRLGRVYNDPEKGLKLTIRSEPQASFNVGKEGADKAAFSKKVYDLMADNSFKEFESRLAEAYGFRGGN